MRVGLTGGIGSGKSTVAAFLAGWGAAVTTEILFSVPVTVTSITTAIAFLSLNFSELPPFRDLGNIVSIGIGMAYLPAEYSKLGTRLQIQVRDRAFPAEVVKKPFYRPTPTA